ncbi:geranylgeranyl transferase type-1 subunit beta [Venturia canescens]|uniref:geranylgeranyl transferase type-1 subunit beta n=1 Tax=Venturia canescens TaxID=32260 RepID=UPI001C9D0AD7|nr:geranylgeranyl transferase type-1 subunit beta [Venturia canescens]
MTELVVAKKKHTKLFKWLIQMMPTEFAEYDSSRMSFAFFSISGLDVLNTLDESMAPDEKKRASDWIYRLQVRNNGPKDGFQASTMVPDSVPKYQRGHLAMTYTSLATLLVLGDDLARIQPYRKALALGVQACQCPDGSFSAMLNNSESDMRFLYCACCISAIIDDWSGVDKPRAIEYILQSISYDGAMGQGPDLESHGGSTFCAVASLVLMKELDNVLSNDQLQRLRRWCLMRQTDGFQGRPGKPSDTCYSFWIGATLQLLDVAQFSDHKANRDFVLSTQDMIFGGFGKFQDARSDPLHTYLGLGGLSLLGEPGLQPMNAALNISNRAYAHLKEIHKRWQSE